MVKDGMKFCPKCGRTLPIEMFWKNRHSSDGHQGRCKDCQKENVKNLYRKYRKDLSYLTTERIVDELKRRGYVVKIIIDAGKIC